MKKVRILVDILMYILFIILMGHHITGNFIHEILGTLLFVLFIIHTVLNYRFYKNLFKGKYKAKRIIMTVIDLILLISMIGIIISSIIISNEVFKFIHIGSKVFGRKLHTLSTNWSFVIMSIHLGIHLNAFMIKINNKMKNHTLEYVYYLIIILTCIYGVYSILNLNLISGMFLLDKFRIHNLTKSARKRRVEN